MSQTKPGTQAENRVNYPQILNLLIGFCTGFCVSYIYTTCLSNREIVFKSPGAVGNARIKRISAKIPLYKVYDNPNASFYGEDSRVALEMSKKVRVLCWVMTHPGNHRSKADHVLATWGRRCNKILFMSSQKDSVLPVVKLPVSEGRDHLWAKTKEAFRYVYERHRRDADWFLKADDDTFVIVENLRYMLSGYNANEPLYFGCRFKPFVKQGFMSGGAGYVISKKALQRFVHIALPTPTICSMANDGDEDVEMGKCLHNVGVKAMDSRDAMGRGRFFPFIPEDHLFPSQNYSFWYWRYIYYQTDEGLDCCSNFAISFHYMKPKEMYVFNYLLYHLRPYGIKYGINDTSTPHR